MVSVRGRFVEREATDEALKKLLNIEEEHIRKYGKKKMSLEELDNHCAGE